MILPAIMPLDTAHAQRGADVWHFGEHASIRFDSNRVPHSERGSAKPAWIIGGCASICDPLTGQLLMYTNGFTVWDRNNMIITNGDGLDGSGLVEQSSLFLRDPANPNNYVLVTNSDFWPINRRQSGLYYSTIQSDSGGRNLHVVLKNIPMWSNQFPGYTTHGLIGIRRCSGVGYWVIGQPTSSYQFLIWSLDSTGMSHPPSIQTPGPLHSTGSIGGTMKATVDGRRIAVIRSCRPQPCELQAVDLIDFDPVTGRIDPATILSIPMSSSGAIGAAFSPDGTKLYVTENYARFGGNTTTRMLQYDLSAGDSAAIVGSRYVVADTSREAMGLMQLAGC